MTDTRYAVFTDYKGQARCEEVNEGIRCFLKFRPSRDAIPAKRNIFGRVTKPGVSARKAEYDLQTQLDDKYYNRAEFMTHAFDLPPEPYTFSDRKRYMKPNYWGPVDVIAFINDIDLGKRLKEYFDSQGKTYD
jgi:hypothetical protein